MLSLFFLATLALVRAERPLDQIERDCFVDYAVGETHRYFLDASLDVDHDFSHQQGAETVRKSYSKQLTADVTLVGVDDESRLFHFELAIVAGEWAADEGLEAFRRAQDGALPIDADALNEAYVRAHQHAFYYTQACNGEIVSVFHPASEPASVVATKKMFVTQLSHRAHENAGAKKRAAPLAEHVELERDNHGERATSYSYARKRAVDNVDELHVTKSFDTVRFYRPPAELRQTGDALDSWSARTADQQTTTMRDGIIHRIERRSELDFPPEPVRYRMSAGRKRSETDPSASAAEDDAVNAKLSQVKGNSFWIKARARSSLEHSGQRKRAAPEKLVPTHELGVGFLQHLTKRHATEFKSDVAHTLESDQMPGPGSLEDTLDDLLSDKATVDAAVQLHLLLLHNKDATLNAIAPLLPSTSAISDDARARLLKIVAQIGTEREQQLLRQLLNDESQSLTVRLRILTALRGVMRPTTSTLESLRQLMKLDGDASTDRIALRKSATLIWGVLAENVNATDVALARQMRSDLLERLMFAETEDERHVLVSALDNAYEHGASADDVLIDRLALAEQLVAKYTNLRDQLSQTRYMFPQDYVTEDYDEFMANVARKRNVDAIERPPTQFTNDSVSCETGSNRLLRTVFLDRTDSSICTPCKDQNLAQCRNCVAKTLRTNEPCPPPRCGDPSKLECGNGTSVEVGTVDASGARCGASGRTVNGTQCTPELCRDCTNCRNADGRACGALCKSATGTPCPEPPNWFAEQFIMFFGEDKCKDVERFAQCQFTIGKMYNDLRPAGVVDFQWVKRVGGSPVTGKIEVILDAVTTDDLNLRDCGPNEMPFQGRSVVCKQKDLLSYKVFAGAWAGLEAYQGGETYSYQPNQARLEVAAAYLQIKSSVAKFWQAAQPTAAQAANGTPQSPDSTRRQAESICDKPVEFALYYNFAGKTYYHETTKDLIDDKEGKSTCFLVNQTCSAQKPPQRAWQTSTKDIYGRYLPDLLGDYDLGGIPLKLELIVNSEARVHHAISYQYSEWEGGLMLNGFVEPQADCVVSMSATISWAANFSNTREQGTAQEMRNLIKIGIKAHIEVFKVMFPAIGAVNFETSKPCSSMVLQMRALGGRVDVILEVMGVNVFQFLGGLFGVKQTLFEWKGLVFDLPVFENKCCKLCPGSCQRATVEKDGLNGAHARCDFTRGECVCTPGWDGKECMIPCPQDCDVNAGILCDKSVNFTTGGGRFAPRNRCMCDAGSWGFDCSLACPGGRKNPCNNNTDVTMTWKGMTKPTCKSDGTCDCWDAPPRGPFFGPRCDITCGDPKLKAPTNDPDFTRCGKVGVSRAECKYDATLGSASCKCARNWYGAKCDQVCPLTADDRKAPCSLRGECYEVDGKAACLCDLGFFGATCEFMSYAGSGLALAFDGKEAAAKVTFPLTDKELGLSPNEGFTMMGWFQPLALPTSARGATIMRWRWGEVRLQMDGSIALCDMTSCGSVAKRQAGQRVTVGGDEKNWYFFAAAMQNSNLGAGTRKVWLVKFEDAIGASVDSTVPLSDMGGANVIVGENFNGLVDHLSIINRVATPTDLNNYRFGAVAHSTPGVVFQAMCDEGRGNHVYAEQPFIAGPKDESVKWSRSLVPLKWASVNSDIAPPFKVFEPTKPAMRSYNLHFDGKRIIKGFLAYRIQSPMSTTAFVECKLTVSLVDPTVPLKIADDKGRPLTDDQLRAADTRQRFQIINEMSVSGDGSMKDPVPIPVSVLQQFRSGVIDLEFKVAASSPAPCFNKESPLIISKSFVTLEVAQVDAVAQASKISGGFMAVTPMKPLSSSWTVELWLQLDFIRVSGGDVSTSLIMSLYPKGASLDLVNRKPNFAFFLRGETERGVRAVFDGASTVTLNGYDMSKQRNDWFHVMLSVSNSGGTCAMKLYFDGKQVGLPQSSTACGSGQITGWGDSANEVRFGENLEGTFNDIILHNAALTPIDMLMAKNFMAPTIEFAFPMDDRNPSMNTAGMATFADASGKVASGLSFVKGVYRNQIFGVSHRWKLCPGIDVLNPERVCSNTRLVERGLCYVEEEENEGVMQLSYKCKCNGYGGAACEKSCAGEIKKDGKLVSCNGRGRCVELASEDKAVQCNCEKGFKGDGCEYMCPGWDVSNPPGQEECNGAANSCKLNAARTGVVCQCAAASQRYGLACEYMQNSSPLAGCEECSAGEQCVDGVCDCVHPYYRVGDMCQQAQTGHSIRPLLALVAASLLALAVA